MSRRELVGPTFQHLGFHQIGEHGVKRPTGKIGVHELTGDATPDRYPVRMVGDADQVVS